MPVPEPVIVVRNTVVGQEALGHVAILGAWG